MKFVSERWHEFFRIGGPKTDDIAIYLYNSPDLDEKVFPEGWSMIRTDGARQAIFSSHGKASFALSYGICMNDVAVHVRKALGSYVRSGIMYGMLTALHRECVGLHGVTLCCRGQNIILSAPSGTGKTTLARLLETECGARIINGDFAMLSISEDGVMFEPTPFCGTSRICLNERVRIDRIVFLEQSATNRWQDLGGRATLMNFLGNAFVPSFDRQMQQKVQENIIRIIPEVAVSSFAFAPTGEAADLFAKMIECEGVSSQ